MLLDPIAFGTSFQLDPPKAIELWQRYLQKEQNIPQEKKIVAFFGHDEFGFAYMCAYISHMATEGQTEENRKEYPDFPTPDKCKDTLLSMIDETIRSLKTLHEANEEKEEFDTEAKLLSLSLPSLESVNKILRYETTIERQLYKAINQLERLQRRVFSKLCQP